MLELEKDLYMPGIDLCVPDWQAPHLQGPYVLLRLVGR